MKKSKMQRFDLHVHSSCSDGKAKPEEIVEFVAKHKNLAGFALTDHDNLAGIKRAKAAAAKAGIVFIPGIEITTPLGDVLCYGVEELPKAKELLEFMDKLRSAGALLGLAHPFAGVYTLSFVDLEDLIKEKFHAIEIWNGMCPIAVNAEATRLSKRLGMTGIAGSDAHWLEAVGAAYTECKAESADEVLKAIKNGNVQVGWI
jgi:predicted metal-dependent phosphoesterase TrpH